LEAHSCCTLVKKHQPSNKDDKGSRSAGSSEALSPRCQKVSSVPNFGNRRESIVSTSERVGEKDVLLESQASDSRSGQYELEAESYSVLSTVRRSCKDVGSICEDVRRICEDVSWKMQAQLHVGALRSRQWERGTLL